MASCSSDWRPHLLLPFVAHKSATGVPQRLVGLFNEVFSACQFHLLLVCTARWSKCGVAERWRRPPHLVLACRDHLRCHPGLACRLIESFNAEAGMTSTLTRTHLFIKNTSLWLFMQFVTFNLQISAQQFSIFTSFRLVASGCSYRVCLKVAFDELYFSISLLIIFFDAAALSS